MDAEFLSHSDAAVLNRNLILRYVRKHKFVSRTDIWSNMRISRASVTQIIRQMQESGLIMEAETGRPVRRSNAKGRSPSRNLCVNENSRFMYVFDWNERMLCLVNLGGAIIESKKLAFPQKCDPMIFSKILMGGIAALRDGHPVDPEKLLGFGISMPGLIDCRNQTVLNSVELNWRNVNMKDLFASEFGENIFLEQTANMIALGEYEFGAAKDYNHILLILMEEEGIGTSVVVHGDCQHGHNYMYGELGHIKLPSDIPCSCGQKGCLEAVVRYRLMNTGNVIDREIIGYLSTAIATAINLYDPGIVLLTGKLAWRLTDEQLEAMIGSIRDQVTDGRIRELDFHVCTEENYMGIKGMSAHIFNHHFNV